MFLQLDLAIIQKNVQQDRKKRLLGCNQNSVIGTVYKKAFIIKPWNRGWPFSILFPKTQVVLV